MTYKEKFALLDKENKSPIEKLFARYYMFQFSGDLFCDYDKGHISKEKLFLILKGYHIRFFKDTDINIINNYKKDDNIKEFCIRIYILAYNISKCGDDIEKLRKLFINASYEDSNYIIRKQKKSNIEKI